MAAPPENSLFSICLDILLTAVSHSTHLTTRVETTMANATFHPFLRLPPELRVIIWRESLPEQDVPALFFYKKGSWLATDAEKTNENDETEDDTISLSFHHYVLEHVPVRIPLASVNYEARSIALAWVREQGIQAVFCEKRQCYVFVRPFDPTRDAIYVSRATWDDFCQEVEVCIDELSDDGSLAHTISDVQHVVLPATILDNEFYASHLSELFWWNMNIRSISFIIGTPPSLEMDAERENSGMSTVMDRRWELRGGHDKAYIWDEKRNKFRRNRHAWVGGKRLYNAIEYASSELASQIGHELASDFRIQPVYVVSK